MIRIDEIVEQIDALQRSDLDAWISDALILPEEDAGVPVFTEMECARIRLICTLHYELEIDAETLPVVVSLIDQLYKTRQRLLKLIDLERVEHVAWFEPAPPRHVHAVLHVL